MRLETFSPTDSPEPEPIAAPPRGLALLRVLGAAAGLLLVVAGAGFAIAMVVILADVLRDPARARPVVDRWEEMVRGHVGYYLPQREAADPATKAVISPAGGSVPQARDLAELIALAARPVALGLLIVVLGFLTSLSLGLVTAGGRLLALTGSELLVMRQILAELRKGGPIR